ncbi:lysoplasmalogenase family protein [Emticicia sp. BO119]|uniref:lysoplasmalogenase family protein n=1 Tax=Emticicia sp. BO119 TaxID=2757768 RepID=UPI0015F1013B|nr:lysoplasmalogenase family protein [Emticicia sp. BO119]MBA4849122.1 hypothetical protein [Emticicia sp. BO119]
MPLRLTLIYITCCLIDIVAYIYHREWFGIASSFPPLCLLIFFFLQRHGGYKLRDYTYTFGLLLAAVGDITFEIRTNNAKALSLLFYMLSFSFYIATVRKETVFTFSSKELLKVFLNLLLITTPFLIIFSKLPSNYFFSSILYMVFLSLFYITALLRKTNKSSYQWLLAGASLFVLLTVCEAYFSFIIKIPYEAVINKVTYGLAQYATFMGVIKTYKNFYPGSEN